MGFSDAAGGYGEAVGSAAGYYETEDQRKREAAQRAAALAQIMGVNGPQFDQSDLGPSEFGRISEDPRLKAAQLQALQGFMDKYRAGGLDAQAQAQQAEAFGAANQQDRARRAALSQMMAARGRGGSGSEYAAQLENAQSSAQTNAMAGLDAASGAQQRALQSLMAGGQLGTTMRGQEYEMASRKAAAQDAIAKFNLMNRNQLAQQQFQNQMGLAGQKYGALQNDANFQREQAKRVQDLYAGVGRGVGGLAGAPVDIIPSMLSGSGGKSGPGQYDSYGGGRTPVQAPSDQYRLPSYDPYPPSREDEWNQWGGR